MDFLYNKEFIMYNDVSCSYEKILLTNFTWFGTLFMLAAYRTEWVKKQRELSP